MNPQTRDGAAAMVRTSPSDGAHHRPATDQVPARPWSNEGERPECSVVSGGMLASETAADNR